MPEPGKNPDRLFEQYLGDGAYVYWSVSGNVVLYTSDGVTETNRVELEVEVLNSFETWLEAARLAVESIRDSQRRVGLRKD